MNRRILLIDSDPTFRTTLTVLLQRYRIDVLYEPDGDEAIALGVTDSPELIVVGVEEPEKAGFKLFQRIKKGPLSKVPIMLATGSVAPESFTKHKNLRVHANSYADKRSLTKDELHQKLDELIGLGDPSDHDDLDIPVEVDDVAVHSGDVVVDEEVALDDQYVAEQRIDAAVAEDVDDAFAGMMGDEPIPEPVSEIGAEPAVADEVAAADEVERGFDEPSPTRADLDATMEALRSERTTAPPPVGAARYDEPVAEDDGLDTFSKEAIDLPPSYPVDDVVASNDMIPIGDLSAATNAEAEPAEPAPATIIHTSALVGGDVPRPAVLESTPAIMLDSDDLLADEDVIEEEEVDTSEADSGGVPEPVHHPRSAEDAADAAAAREISKPKFIESSTQTSSPSIDLGLDRIAEDARNEQSGAYPPVSGDDRDQSGVYDRRALRKIGELERQAAQLKAELERARVSADAAARGSGREQQFLNLRERMMASDNELKKTRADLAARERELAEVAATAQADMAQRASYESRTRELEQQLAAEAAKSAAAVKKEQSLASTLDNVQRDLAEKVEALDEAVAARAHLEGELANEQALRAASASDAERALRVDREQIIGRHQHEIAALRQELGAHNAALVEDLRAQLTGEHAEAVAALRQQLESAHAGAVAAAVAAARQDVGGEAEAAIGQLEQQHTGDIARLREEHAAAVARLTQERDAAISKVASERDELVTRTQRDSAALIERTKTEASAQLEELQAELANAHAELEERAGAHARELATQATQHAAALAGRERELTTARQDDAIAHTAAVAELQARLDQAAAEHARQLAGATRELAAQETRLAAQHAEELATVAADHQRALEDVQRTAAEHAATAQRAADQHAAEVTQARESADREIAELRQVILGAKRNMEEATAKHQAERAALEQAHAQAISEQTAQHERAMAVANGEILKVKAVSDAEHNRAIAAKDVELERVRTELTAEHATALRDVTSERDELQRGLSAARDTIKRSESELSAAVQTIADRNAELRTATSAIGERDQRIAELRKEIEAIEAENANYQEQVLRAYQKIKADEAMVARAKKAMAIALTVLDDQGTPKSEPT